MTRGIAPGSKHNGNYLRAAKTYIDILPIMVVDNTQITAMSYPVSRTQYDYYGSEPSQLHLGDY